MTFRRPWTPAEVQQLRCLYTLWVPVDIICDVLDRPFWSVKVKIAAIRVRRPAAYRTKVARESRYQQKEPQ